MNNDFLPENRAVYDVMWKNTASAAAFPLQEWLYECATKLRYRKIAYRVLDSLGI